METQMSFWHKTKRLCRRLDVLTVIFSLILGALIWYYVNSRRIDTRTLRARVEISVPDHWQIDSPLPRSRTVVLRGPQQLVQSLRPEDMRFSRRLEAPTGGDAAKGAASREVDIFLKADDLMGFPRDVIEVVDIPDPKISLSLVRPVRRYIPVAVDLSGTLPDGYVIKGFQHSPQYLPVVAPEDYFVPGLEIKTRPVDLSGRTESFVAYVDLQPLIAKGRVISFSESVFTQFTVEPLPARKEVENVPVGLLLATPMEKLSGHKIVPSHVTVRVEGHKKLLDTLSARNLTVYIDSRDLGTSAQTEYTLKCRALALDVEGARVVGIVPSEVKWQMPSGDAAEKSPAAKEAAPAAAQGAVATAAPPPGTAAKGPGTAGAPEKAGNPGGK